MQIIVLIFPIVLLVSGCKIKKDVQQLLTTFSSRPTLTLTGEPVSSPSKTVETTPTNMDVSTPTIRPMTVSTGTPAVSQSQESLPTLPANEIDKVIMDLFVNNRGCLLPCWWGITPGVTSWSEAKSLLEPFAELSGFISPTDKHLSVEFAMIPVPKIVSPYPEQPYYLQYTFIVKNDIVDSIELEFIPQMRNITAYTLPEFLNTYGEPAEIWIHTYSSEYPKGVLPFIAILYYPEQGIWATFGPDKANFTDDKVRACQWNGAPSTLGLWSPDKKKSFIEASNMFRWKFDEPGVLTLPLDQATEIDVRTFYKIFKQPDSNTCLETPKNLWPGQF